MNIFFNISHPAHVHLFKNAITILKNRGHTIVIGARKKEFTVDLLNAYGFEHTILTRKGVGILGLVRELLIQQYKIAHIIKKHSIDIMLQMNGIFNAPVGKLFNIPTLAFSDTENDIFANKFSFFLTKHVFVPTCFDHGTFEGSKNMIHYPGYHELAYLSPQYFLKTPPPQKRFLVRFVGWGAGHDIGETGLSAKQKIKIVMMLNNYGTVHVSSEAPLPPEIDSFAHKLHPSKIHKFMRGCKMIVGESATMASEAACLGIPAIFISNTGRGYTTEQDKKYDLIKHFGLNQWEDIIHTIDQWASKDLYKTWQKRQRQMLADKIEVTNWLVDLIENYPDSITSTKKYDFKRYSITCAE